MAYESVCCYSGVDVQALQARSDERLVVDLVSLESVRVAAPTWISSRSWQAWRWCSARSSMICYPGSWFRRPSWKGASWKPSYS